MLTFIAIVLTKVVVAEKSGNLNVKLERDEIDDDPSHWVNN